MRFKKTSWIIKLVLLVIVIYAVVTLVNLQDQIAAANAEAAELEAQVLYAEQEKALVQEELDELGTDKSVMKLARTRLGMVGLGEVVFCDADEQ